MHRSERIDETRELRQVGRAACMGSRAPNVRFIPPPGESLVWVAFLASIEPRPLVIPLPEGRSIVGRAAREFPSDACLEGAQWIFECSTGQAGFHDAASTNLSLLFKSNAVADHEVWRRPHALIAGMKLVHLRGVELIPHAHESTSLTTIDEGDVLVTCYGALVFGWTAG